MAFRDRWEPYQKFRRKFVGTKVVAGIAARITHTGAEVLVTQTPAMRVTSAGAEVLVGQTPAVRVTGVGMEVLVTIGVAPPPSFVSHIYEDYV